MKWLIKHAIARSIVLNVAYLGIGFGHLNAIVLMKTEWFNQLLYKVTILWTFYVDK